MALPFPISPSQTDAKSPVDDNLMDSIRENLDYLETIATQGGVPVYVWNVNGPLSQLPGGIAKRIDMQFLHVTSVFNRVRVSQNQSGTEGATEIDIRYHSTPKTPIIAITPQLSQNTLSVSQITPNLATQSITRAANPELTQSITRAKPTLSIQSIVILGGGLVRYNLDSMADADYAIGYPVLITGCTNVLNNGTFTIVERNNSGWASIVVNNPSAVAQTSPAGDLDLQLFSYNLVNPASDQFVAGEPCVFTLHSNSLSNGTKTIHSVNDGGNNVVVIDPTGVTQGGVAGVTTTSRMSYNFAALVNSDFAIGETAQFTGHSNALNNINAEIKAINVSGNNIIIVNPNGVTQGSIGGLTNTRRWKYTFSSNPSADVTLGDRLVFSGHTNPVNDGTFTVVQVNNLTNDNVVIHNAQGVAQAGAAGAVNHVLKVVKFNSDQSLIYSTDSYIEIQDCADGSYNAVSSKLPYKVIQQNRGGGANYNLVIEEESGGTVPNPSGFVMIEAKSIFTQPDGLKPQLTADTISNSAGALLTATFTGSAITTTPIPDQTYLGLYILRTQSGEPRDLSVMLT